MSLPKINLPHNLFLNFWAETSLLGGIAIVWIIVLVMKHSLVKKTKELDFAALLALIVVFIHGLVDVPYFKNDLAMLTWILLMVFIVFSQNQLSRKNYTD